MNSLSWLIYLADVLGSADAVFTIALSVGFCVYILAILSYTLVGQYGDGPKLPDFPRWPVTALLVSLVVLVIVPSRETIYAIALSEVGEEVLHSEAARLGIDALEVWLEKQIDGVDEAQADSAE